MVGVVDLGIFFGLRGRIGAPPGERRDAVDPVCSGRYTVPAPVACYHCDSVPPPDARSSLERARLNVRWRINRVVCLQECFV